MKKLISVFLVLVMMLAVAVPAAAAYYPGQETPIIIIRGDGSHIVDADGEEIWPVSIGEDEEDSKNKILEAAQNILFPNFINGVLFDRWDGYCDAVYEELAPLFEETKLDKNGEASNGSGLSAYTLEHNRWNQTYNTASKQGGYFGVTDYTYFYDWRLSPKDVIDGFHSFITNVMNVTGSSKVSLVGRCLGTSFLMAYVEKYGSLGHIKSVVFDSGVVNGCALLSDTFQGKLDFDDKSFERFIADGTVEYFDPQPDEFGNIDDIALLLMDVIRTSVALLNETGTTTVAFNMIRDIYKKVYTNIVPRLMIDMYGTFPGYWTSIGAEDFDASIDFVFGPEGSENRTEYAGLIEKLNWYNDTVGSRIPEIISECESNGINVAAIAKYGYQLYPFVESRNELADGMVELSEEAFGATTAKVNETLSQEYIEERSALGFADYISNDKAVDASTSLLKDNVWIIKGIHHDNWTNAIDDLIHEICQGKLTSVKSSPEYPQFMVYDEVNDQILPMTDENCGISNWDDINTEKPTLWSRLSALFKWLYSMFRYLFNLMS